MLDVMREQQQKPLVGQPQTTTTPASLAAIATTTSSTPLAQHRHRRMLLLHTTTPSTNKEMPSTPPQIDFLPLFPCTTSIPPNSSIGTSFTTTAIDRATVTTTAAMAPFLETRMIQ
ncbi:hypothetical protein BFW01_g4850 [Lasiodiplodia theobromae]|nr:hypothetical protein BFW01_g4850 [Lasiodiplodia theobromae]